MSQGRVRETQRPLSPLTETVASDSAKDTRHGRNEQQLRSTAPPARKRRFCAGIYCLRDSSIVCGTRRFREPFPRAKVCKVLCAFEFPRTRPAGPATVMRGI